MGKYKIIQLEKDDKFYPQRLKILKMPPKLYVIGDYKILNNDSIAIIGSRNFSENGRNMAEKFSKELTQKGLVIVSGLAIGIDTIAHYSCIENGGKTIAVLGSGFNNIYPEENIQLYNLILETGGAVISEYNPDEKVKKSNFPTRNRIVSGLALGTLVIEAGYRSGTSITANKTIEQGKPVFCIPNSIGNKNSCGTINLVLRGANLVKSSENILSKLPKLNNTVVPSIPKTVNIKEKIELQQIVKKLENTEQIKIVTCIYNNKEIDVNCISKICQLSIQNVNSELMNLEIQGIVIQKTGNKFIINT